MARVHVAAWAETYAGLLPEAFIVRATVERRERQWAAAIAAGRSRIAVVDGLGFASAGPHREAAFAGSGWPEELHAIYLLGSAQGLGLGRALFGAVRGVLPFTCFVVEGNDRARGFYKAMGGDDLGQRDETEDGAVIRDHIYGWR